MVKKTILAIVGGFFLLESVVHSLLNNIDQNIRVFAGVILLAYGLLSKNSGKNIFDELKGLIK